MFEVSSRTLFSVILFIAVSTISQPGFAARGGINEPCNVLQSKHHLVEGYVHRLAQRERLIALKEEQVAAETQPKAKEALQRELTRLYADRAWFLNAIEDANRQASEAAAAITGEGCDIPNLIFVGDSIAPPAPALVPSFGAGPRPLAAAVDHRGHEGSFVTNELVIETSQAAALAARWDGTILENLPATTPPLSLVQIDTTGVDTSTLADLNGTLTDARGAVIEVSSEAGLALLAVAALEAAAGVPVAINWSGTGHGYAEMDLMEELDGPMRWTNVAGGSWSDNPYDWHYLNSDFPQEMGVTDAWTLMDAAGKLDNKIGIGILDMGFRPDFNPDFLPGFQAFSVMAGQDPLMSSNYLGCGDPCPWHGTSVLTTAAGTPDNGAGVVGTGGPAAQPIAIFTSYDMFSTMIALDQGRIAGVRVANMSYGGWVPAGFEWSMAPFGLAMRSLHALGMTMIAAGGNDNGNVDAALCIFDLCWEEGFNYPCELGGVYCVGALAFNARQRAGYSNFGDVDANGDPNGTVDVFAPGTVLVGPDPSAPTGLTDVSGTSIAAPYTAGVAALIWAVDPTLASNAVVRRMDDTAFRNPLQVGGRPILQPLAAVTQTLDETCPCISIKNPVNARTYPEGDAISVMATSYNAGANITSANWEVRQGTATGPVVFSGSGMTGPIVPVVGGGPHHYLLTTNFDDGTVVTDSVVAIYENSSPTVEVLQPADGSLFTTAESVRLRARTTDAGFPGGLPDANVSWYLDGAGPIATGNDTTTVFAGAALGAHTLRVDATDGFETVTDSVGIELITPGANTPPRITIVSPSDGDIVFGTPDGVEWEALITLQAFAEDDDPADILLIDWSVSEEGGPFVPVGSGQAVTDVPFRINSCFGSDFTIRAVVTDSVNSPRSDTVAIQVRGAEIC